MALSPPTAGNFSLTIRKAAFLLGDPFTYPNSSGNDLVLLSGNILVVADGAVGLGIASATGQGEYINDAVITLATTPSIFPLNIYGVKIFISVASSLPFPSSLSPYHLLFPSSHSPFHFSFPCNIITLFTLLLCMKILLEYVEYY